MLAGIFGGAARDAAGRFTSAAGFNPASALGGAAGASVAHSLLGFLDPPARELSYDANWLWPNLYLSSHEAMHCWSHTDMTWESLRWILIKQGINLSPGNQRPGVGPWEQWRQYVLSMQSPPPLDMLIALKQLDRIEMPELRWLREQAGIGNPNQVDPSSGMVNEWLLRHGVKEESAQKVLLNVPFIFTPENSRIILSLDNLAAQAGEIPPPQFALDDIKAKYLRRLSAAGMPDERDREQFEKLIQPPTYKECIDLLNRDLLLKRPPQQPQASQADREREFERLMALEGFTDPQIIKYLRSLAQEFPTESELIDMSVKNVFSAHLSKILQLDDEYEEQPQYIVWTDRRGLSGSPTISKDAMRQHMLAHNQIVKDAGQPGEDEDTVRQQADQYYEAQDKTLLSWAQAFWREHWINVSPSQIYICLHRLRPIDTTKPGGVRAQQRYDEELAPLNDRYNAISAQIAALQADDGHGGNSAERARLHQEEESIVAARYAIAVRYSRQWGRVQFVPGSTEPVPPVTMDIVRTVLRANDYAPRFRDSLAAISYNVLRLVDIRRIVQQSLRDPAFAARAIGWGPLPNSQFEGEELSLVTYVRAWAREQFLDRGQTPDSATVLAELSVVQGRQANTVIARATNPAGRRRYVRLLDKAISIGLIDREAYNRYLERIDVRGGDGAAEVQISADVYSDDLTAQDVSDDSQWQIAFAEEESVAVAEDLFDSGDFGEV